MSASCLLIHSKTGIQQDFGDSYHIFIVIFLLGFWTLEGGTDRKHQETSVNNCHYTLHNK